MYSNLIIAPVYVMRLFYIDFAGHVSSFLKLRISLYMHEPEAFLT
jgi:hypothetical protein